MTSRPPKIKMPPPCRIDGFVAKEANKAVLFRRGPSHYVQIVTWDLNTDEVVSGEWTRGPMYVDCSDISFDGKYALCQFIEQTCLIKPPSFEPLARWLCYWNAGGSATWTRAHEALIHRVNDAPMAVTWFVNNFEQPVPPNNLKFLLTDAHSSRETRMTGRGWNFEKISPHGQLVLEKSFKTGTVRYGQVWNTSDKFWSIINSMGEEVRVWQVTNHQRMQFLDLDHNGRVIFSDKGCLWAWPGFPDEPPIVIADLNDNKPPEHLLK